MNAYLDGAKATEDEELAEAEEEADEEAERSDDSQEDEMEEEGAETELDDHPSVPIIMPRKRYPGARNVETVKDGGFHSCSPIFAP